MASTTIHTLSYKMVADTKQFSAGLLATKSEVQLLKKIMGDTTPEQKAQDAFGRLNNLLDKGKITAQQHAKAMKSVKQELTDAQRAGSQFYKTLDRIDSFAKKGLKVAAGTAATAVGVLGFNVKNEIENMKGIADAAEDLKMGFNDLVRLQQAFIRGGEVSADVVVPALKTMNQNIQMSARDMGKFKALAGELGLEMDTMFALSKMPVLEQFRMIVQQISSMPDQGGKGLMVKKLFGTDENKLTTLLGGGLENLDAIAKTADEFGMTLNDRAASGISNLVTQTEQLSDTWTGLIRQLSVELTPWLSEMVRVIQFVNSSLDRTPQVGLAANDAGSIVKQIESMAGIEQRGMVQFSDNRGKFVREMRGRLNADSLTDFFMQARKLDPNFSEFSLTPGQRQSLDSSALKGNPGGTQEQVQLEILNELRKQVAASQELVRVSQDKDAERRGLIE